MPAEPLYLDLPEDGNCRFTGHTRPTILLHIDQPGTPGQAFMTLSSFTLLTVARFSASDTIPFKRLRLLDISRGCVIAFGIFLVIAGFLVTYPMLKRLRFLKTKSIFRLYYRVYRISIPILLPVAEAVLWVALAYLLWQGVLTPGLPYFNLDTIF